MKALINLLAIVGQFIIVIFASSKYGVEVGVMIFAAIVLNAVQLCCSESDDNDE